MKNWQAAILSPVCSYFLFLDWRSSSLDDSWDSRLPTPLALDFSVGEEEGFTPYTNGGGEDLYTSNGYRGWY